jgi:tRNA G37 N-methylase TrmD
MGPLSPESMRFDIVTIFPGFFESVFAQGIVRRAQTERLVEIRLITTPRQATERADYNGRQVPRYTT